MNRQLLQQALEALEESVDLVQHDYDADWRHGMPTRKAQLDASLNALTTHRAAIAALREALNAPEPEPVALESVHLTRDTRGMCVVRVNGKIAIRDNGDIIDHMATLEWFAAPPAAPASQWMPMDTAPKDGALFLCWVDAVRYGETDEGQQYEEDVSQLDFCYWRTQSDTPDGGWFDPCCGQIGDQQSVTHWMPLPAAPGAAPPAAPADDHATPSGGQEAGPQEDRIEAAYWRFDARHKGYSQWKTAPMSERDAFKAEMRNALESEKVRAEMRLVARGWRRPDAPAAPAPAAPVPLTDSELAKIAVEDEFLLYCDQDSFNEIARAIELAHGITGASK